jgi:hypothetical protein
VKFTLNVLEKNKGDAEKTWPGYMFGGRVRTSTLVLVIAFLGLWWTYTTYRPEPTPKPEVPQVVPPGFVPDPNYTWVPRSRVQQPAPSATYTPTPTSTVPPPPPPPSVPPTTTTAPPPFQLPQLPCVLPAPFCPSTTAPTPSPQSPQPGPGPVPTSSPRAS